MTAGTRDIDITIEALELRRAKLAARAEELSDQIDRMPTPALRWRLEDVAAAIDEIDRVIEARRRTKV